MARKSNVIFPNKKPLLTKEGLQIDGFYLRPEDAIIHGMTLREWGVAFWDGVKIVDATNARQVRDFFCGSQASYYRIKNELKDRGLL